MLLYISLANLGLQDYKIHSQQHKPFKQELLVNFILKMFDSKCMITDNFNMWFDR